MATLNNTAKSTSISLCGDEVRFIDIGDKGYCQISFRNGDSDFPLGINTQAELIRRIAIAQEHSKKADQNWVQAVCGEHGGSLYLKFGNEIVDILIQDSDAREISSGAAPREDILNELKLLKKWLGEVI